MKKQVKLLLVLLFLQCLTTTTLPAQAGLVAWYPFSGNALDESGNGHNGTVYGATLCDDRFGNPKSAYSFDGKNDQIVIGKEPNFPSWDTYAVSLWFLNDGGGDRSNGYGQKILSKAQFYTDFHLSVYFTDGSLIWWSAQGGFNSVNAANQDYRDNQWHHVVLNKKSPSTGDIWVDGVLQNSSSELQAVFNNEDLVIGFTTHSDGYQRKYFSGKIDDIRIYNRVLSESEISDLFTEGGWSYCPAPGGLKVLHVSDTCAALSWNAAGANISYVQFRYRAVGDTAWVRKKRDTTKNTLYIKGLLPGTTYQWQLRSFCTEDTSGWISGPNFTTAGLIAWYPFNGNAHDETGNGHNGTVYGATLSDDRFGHPMSAYSFDGINDKIVIGKEPNFPSWDTYAVSLWFLNDGGGDRSNGYGQKILSKAQFYTDFHLSVYFTDGSLIWWSAQGGFNSVQAANQDYRDSKWHHVVLNKKSPSTGDIWVDGVLQNSSNELQAVFNNEDLVIGFTTHSDGYQRKYFSGKIDDIRIYRGALSESEISDLFTEGGYCPAPSNLRVPKISDTCARLNWSVPDSSVEHIKVSYRRLGDTVWIEDRKKSLENSKWICGLTPNTTYEWKVRNICADNKTGWVNGPNFTTAASLNRITYARVYPNPAKNVITVNYTAQKNGKYIFEITDISGNTLLRKEVNAMPGANRITLDISRFFKGMYFINIIHPDKIRERVQLSKE